MANVKIVFVAVIVAVLLLFTKRQCDFYQGDVNLQYSSDCSPEVATVCYMLYEQLEQALINDHINLYKLFIPNAKADAIVVAITYNINFSNIILMRYVLESI